MFSGKASQEGKQGAHASGVYDEGGKHRTTVPLEAMLCEDCHVRQEDLQACTAHGVGA